MVPTSFPLSEKIDTTSAAGRMMFCMMMLVLAEFGRDVFVERTDSHESPPCQWPSHQPSCSLRL